MKKFPTAYALLAATLLANLAAPANAAIIISEVAPWSSGNSALGADWFELTNTGGSAVTITGWKVDDNSNSFGSALALNDITSIAAGESVIFIETATSLASTFKTLWFGANAPAGLQIGRYSGSGIGLSTAGDAVNIFNAGGVLQAKVTFAASDAVPPLQTFDNASGLNNTAVSLLSAVGVNGAFVAANAVNEIGSPGFIAAAPVPVPAAVWLMGSAIGGIASLRRRKA